MPLRQQQRAQRRRLVSAVTSDATTAVMNATASGPTACPRPDEAHRLNNPVTRAS
jgi:hypothetical protein